MSKSLGNVVNPKEIVEKYGVDALRYYLLSEIPVGLDGDFSIQLFEERYTAHLANSLGNLVNRVLLMTKKYFEGKVPAQTSDFAACSEHWEKYQNEMEKLILNKGVATVFEYANYLNKYIDEEKPWVLGKENNIQKLEEVIYNLLESLRHISLMLWPFLPESAEKMRKQLGIADRKEFAIEKKWGGER